MYMTASQCRSRCNSLKQLKLRLLKLLQSRKQRKSLKLELQLLGVSDSDIKYASNSVKEVQYMSHYILPGHKAMLYCASADFLLLLSVAQYRL
jgi:hypothetical protein